MVQGGGVWNSTGKWCRMRTQSLIALWWAALCDPCLQFVEAPPNGPPDAYWLRNAFVGLHRSNCSR